MVGNAHHRIYLRPEIA